MEYGLKQIATKINSKRKELDSAIERGKNKDYIYNLSIELDELIAEHYRIILFNEEAKKYENYLNVNYKNELIESIRSDVKAKLKKATDIEIECFSNNVFIYVCLLANNVDVNEISKILVLHNNIYDCRIEKINVEIENTDKTDLIFCTDIANKYLEIVKQKM